MNRKDQEHITLQLKTSISSSRNHLPISICIVVFSVFAFVKSNHCKDKDIEGDKALDKRWDLFRVDVGEIFPWLRSFFSINDVWIYALTILSCTDSVYFNVETEWELGSYWTCIFDKSIYAHTVYIHFTQFWEACRLWGDWLTLNMQSYSSRRNMSQNSISGFLLW